MLKLTNPDAGQTFAMKYCPLGEMAMREKKILMAVRGLPYLLQLRYDIRTPSGFSLTTVVGRDKLQVSVVFENRAICIARYHNCYQNKIFRSEFF